MSGDFPHPISCPDCQAAGRCNACGRAFSEHPLITSDRCIYGRCLRCHRERCITRGPITPNPIRMEETMPANHVRLHVLSLHKGLYRKCPLCLERGWR